jgi:hypothetical protein
MLGPTSPRSRFLPAVLLPVLLILLPVLGATPASAQPAPATYEEYEERVTPAEHYAALLAREPRGAAVVVDDVLSGRYDVGELEADLHDSFGELGVPYHVVASPFPDTARHWGGELLPALVDRVGADGLYVHLRPGGTPHAVAVGGAEDLQVDLAVGAVRYSPDLDYDAPLDQVAEAFTGALAEPDLAGRVERLRQDYEAESASEPSAWEEFLEDLDPTTYAGPSNLGFLAGSASGGLAAVVVVTAVLVQRGRRRGTNPAALVTVAALAGLALFAAPAAAALTYMNSVPPGGSEVVDPFDRARAEPPHVSSTVRVERVLRQMGDEPLYVDPLSPLPREGLARAAERAGGAPVPVRAVVIPMTGEDESGGDPHLFAHAMRHVLGEDAVYAVLTADYDGTVRTAVAPFGLGLSSHDLSQGLDGEGRDTPAAALDILLDNVEDAPRDGRAADPEPSEPYDHTPEPRAQRFWSDFLPGALIVGPIAALLLAGAVVGPWFLVRSSREARARRPSRRALRRAAERERARLASLLSSDRSEGLPRSMMPPVEAALMVMGADPDDLDLVGVVVVSRRAHAAVEDPGSADTSPCMINPLHGPATASKRSGLAGRQGLLPVCRPCADLADDRRAASVLRVRDGGGAAREHLSMEGRAWVRHRYGAKSPARMAQRLLEEIHAR